MLQIVKAMLQHADVAVGDLVNEAMLQVDAA